MRRTTTAADTDLLAALAARGVTVTRRQLERWRQLGFIKTRRRGRGRGGGSVSEYADGTVDIVVDLVRLLQQRRSLHDAALVLFVRGHDLDIELVRRAFVRYLRRASEELARVSARRGDDNALAPIRRSAEGRAFLRRLRENGIHESAIFASIGALVDIDAHADALMTLLVGSGFTRIAAELLDDRTIAALRRELAGFNVEAMVRAVDEAGVDRLRTSASVSSVVVPFISRFSSVLAFRAGEPHIPGLTRDGASDELAAARFVPFLLFAWSRGLDVGRAFELGAQYGDAVAAMVEIAQSLRRSDGRFFGPDAARELERLKPYEQEAVMARIREFAAANPKAITAMAAIAASADTEE